MERLITPRKIASCALNRIFGFEPRIGLSLIEYAGSPEAVFTLDRDSIRAAMGPYWKYICQIGTESWEAAAKELEAQYGKGVSFIAWGDDDYPVLLKECEDPPIGIYVKSCERADSVFGRRPSIAVVGTRDMSPYGEEWCRDFVECLAGSATKPLIVSGLAYGVDITAHRAALENGIPTVAVMATGIDIVYPRNHIHIADRMAETEGCALITDYPVGTSPLPIHFMRRNRIIAGLAEHVILVESRVKGGGMITARLAHSYNRDVYALPGRVDDIRSQGCNMLVREKIAEAAGTAAEMAARLGLDCAVPSVKRNPETLIAETYPNAADSLKEEMVAVVRAIKRNRGIDISGIRQATGLSHASVAGITEILCADGIISMDLIGQCRLL